MRTIILAALAILLAASGCAQEGPKPTCADVHASYRGPAYCPGAIPLCLPHGDPAGGVAAKVDDWWCDKGTRQDINDQIEAGAWVASCAPNLGLHCRPPSR